MALIKTTVSETGFTADYWKIESVFMNSHTGQVTINLSLFKDEAASTSGKTSVGSATVATTLSLFDDQISASDTLAQAAYEFVKTQAEFSDAIDG